MWEVRVADGRLDELLAFVLAHADPGAQIYRAGGGDGSEARIVVIDSSGAGLPEPPAELVARPPHAWPFTLVRGGTSD